MRAIVIAAGMGKRLKHFTAECPKCMLSVGGKTILERQIEVYRKFGITDIVVIKGYLKEMISYPGITYRINDDYKDNNILNSLFFAEDKIEGELIVSYSDIIFEDRIVENLLKTKGDIVIVVDTDWKHYYADRKEHPIEEAENVIMDGAGRVIEIGKVLSAKDTVHGEFIGMLRLTSRGAEVFKDSFRRAKREYWGKPFVRAKDFRKAYLTDMLQHLADCGIAVNCATVKRGWCEIDTVEDLERLRSRIDTKLLQK